MKRILTKCSLIAIVFCLLPASAYAIKIDPGNEGKDTIIFKGKSIKLGGSPTASEGLAPYKYEWKSDKGAFTSTVANPTVTPTETTTYTVTVEDDDGFKCEESVKVIVVEFKIKTLEFKSDHNLICDGSSVTTAGSRYPDIEWDPDATVNAPITHTASATTKIDIELGVEIKELPSNTQCKFIGTSSESALEFDQDVNLSAGSNVKVALTAKNAIGIEIRKIEQSITWKVEIKKAEEDLGPTGPHTIYTTVNTPNVAAPSLASVPNKPRMEIAVPRVKTAITQTGSLCFPGIVWRLNNNNGTYNLGNHLPGDVEPWKLPSTPGGADCITISKFVRNMCMVSGIPGNFDAKTYYALYRTAADPSRPNKSRIGTLNSPLIRPGSSGTPLTAGLDPTWILSLPDVNCRNVLNPAAAPGTVGCGPQGLNAFEAAVIYKYGGNTYYIPGGTTRIYDNVDHVVQIFQTLAWVYPDDHDANPATPDKLVVKAVDHTYSVKPNISPCP